MGAGIAYVLATASDRVWVVEPRQDRITELRRTVTDFATSGVARGKLTSGDADTIVERIVCVASVAELPTGLDLVVESIPEQLGLKHAVLCEIEKLTPRLLATNTSALSIDALSSVLEHPEDFIGMHFFNPVPSLKLVEVVRGVHTSDKSVERALAVVVAIGKESALVRDSPGFATSRLDLCLGLEAIRMFEEGVGTAEDIDRAVRLAYRHPVGPLKLSDIVGLDVRLDIAKSLTASLGERFAPPALLEAKVAAGELGQKSGRGFYDW
jgi:3-hydroxybutyryl-CoA dehydrogenase